MTSHHPNEVDSGTTDSITSSTHSDYPSHHRLHDESQPRVRFMCSFGGKILPRPQDNQLRYVGGDTRMVAVQRSTTFSSLLNKLSKLSGIANITVKYQLPNEDLDALITVTTDEDMDNMMEEYDRFAHNSLPSKTTPRLRLFLFSNDSDSNSRASSISSLLDGSTKREHWFLDALNGGGIPGSGLERGRSEVSSIVSEVPDYLFGMDNSDEQPREPKLKTRLAFSENVSVSDPGSPAPPVSSPFCSTSAPLAPPAVPSVPNLPPVKTKPDNPDPVVELKEPQIEGFTDMGEPPFPQMTGYASKPMWHYAPDAHYPAPTLQSVPVYYVSGPVSSGNVPGQPIPARAHYMQQFPAPPGQVPVMFHQPVAGMGQAYGGGVRPVAAVDQAYGGGARPVTAVDPYDMPVRVVPDGMNPALYYGVRNAGLASAYPGMVMSVGEEVQGSGSDTKMGRVPNSS